MKLKQWGAVGLLGTLCACSTMPSGLESPKHPYDFRGYSGSDSASIAMAKAIEKIDEDREKCYANPDVQCRNKVVGELQDYISDYWRRFKSDFFGRAGATNVAFDGTVATLTAAAPITTPTSAQNILTALATSLLAFRTSMSSNLLGGQTAIVLLGQMDSDRLVISQRIADGLDKDLAHYSFDRAMSDLSEYASSMSVASALVSLSRAGGASAQKVKDQQADEVVQQSAARAAAAAASAAKSDADAAQAHLKARQAAAAAAALPGGR